MADLSSVIEELGGDTFEGFGSLLKPSDGGLGMMKSVLDVQNKQMQGMQLQRELEGPSPREKWEAQRRQQQTTQMFGMWTSLLKEPNLSDAARDLTVRTMEQVYYHLTPFEKAGLRPWMTAEFLDPSQKAMQEFDRTHEVPQRPRTATDMELFEHNKGNMGEWADYKIRLAEYNYQRNVVGYGVEKAKELSPVPKMFPLQVDDASPGEQWYGMKDDVTQQTVIMELSSIPIAEVQKAFKEGLATPGDLINFGAMRIGKDIEGTYKGQKTLTTEWHNFKTGQRELKTRGVGPGGAAGEKAMKELPNYIKEAMLMSASEDPKEAMKKASMEGKELYLQMKRIEDSYPALLKDGDKWKRNPEFEMAVSSLQQRVAAMSPGVKFIPFPLEDMLSAEQAGAETPLNRTGLFNLGGGYHLDGAKWMMQRVDELKMFNLPDGTKVGFWWNNEANQAIDKRGRPIPETKGKAAGSVLDIKVKSKRGRPTDLNFDIPGEGMTKVNQGFGSFTPQARGSASRAVLELAATANQWQIITDSMGIEHAKATFEGLIQHHGGLKVNFTVEEAAAAWNMTVEKAKEFIDFLSGAGPLGGGY